MTLRPRKRIYKEVGVGSADGMPVVTLDGRSLRSPAKSILRLPNESLALAIAKEWRDQEDEVRPQCMPLTRIAATAIDRVSPERDGIIAQVSAYGETDLLCYRSENADLSARQAEKWQPLLDWVDETLSAPLVIATGIIPAAQDRNSLVALRDAVATHNDLELAALQLATTITGSLVLALALSHGRLDAQSAWELSHLDETWQAERWGDDVEAVQRAERLRLDLHAVQRLFELSRLS